MFVRRRMAFSKTVDVHGDLGSWLGGGDKDGDTW